MPDRPPLDLLPRDPLPRQTRTPAPAWVALCTAWLGLLVLIAALILPFLHGSQSPRLELEHASPYSPADRFFPVPIYGSTLTIFLGIVVLRQMRGQPRPYATALANQRIQAWVGIILGLLAAMVMYIFAALRATGRGL